MVEVDGLPFSREIAEQSNSQIRHVAEADHDQAIDSQSRSLVFILQWHVIVIE